MERPSQKGRARGFPRAPGHADPAARSDATGTAGRRVQRGSGRATPAKRQRSRVERDRHPAGRSGVPAGLISAGTDETERNVVKWRIDGDRAGPTGALLRALFLATRPTPVGQCLVD